MSLSHPLLAAAASEDRRAALLDAMVEGLCVVILAVATLYVLVGDTPFTRDAIDRSTEISPVNRYVWLSLLALSVPVLWVRLRQAIALVLAAWPMLLLFAWFAASTQWALDPAASVRRVLLYVVILIMSFAVSVGLRRPHAAHLVLALCAGLVVLVDLASWPVVPGIAMTELGFAGMHPQKNVAGEVALFAGLANATCLTFARGRVRRMLHWLSLAGSAAMLAASLSATSLSLGIGVAVLAPVATAVLRGRPGGLAIAASLAALAPAAVLLLYVAWAGVTGLDPMAPLRNVTFTERTDLWQFLIENIRLRPWLGSGFGSFWAIDPAVQPSMQTGLWFSLGKDIANQGHDAYLDIAATTGLIGLALVLGVQARAIALGGWLVRQGGSIFALAFLVIVSVHSITESSLFTANSGFGTFFVLLAIGLEQARLTKTSRRGKRVLF